MRLLEELDFAEAGRILSVQSDAANPLASSWEASQEYGNVNLARWEEVYEPQTELGETTATAARIGNAVSWEKVMREIHTHSGAVLTAQELKLNAAVLVAGRDGHFVCPQTGTALAGLRQAVKRHFVEGGSRVVVVSTATGLKFPDVPVKYGAGKVVEISTCGTTEVAKALGI